ncbi:hypothetical protein AMECASPLE_000549 [Ameca splendens]|uniref:Uncharacterized protein n=1 Tax=Ameca splendens TaxID=208324 RepID=A0ABV0Y9B6_9TELE
MDPNKHGFHKVKREKANDFHIVSSEKMTKSSCLWKGFTSFPYLPALNVAPVRRSQERWMASKTRTYIWQDV